MAKAYWVAFYHSISNPEALAAYAKLAGPAAAVSLRAAMPPKPTRRAWCSAS